jgi:hypothetical protein
LLLLFLRSLRKLPISSFFIHPLNGLFDLLRRLFLLTFGFSTYNSVDLKLRFLRSDLLFERHEVVVQFDQIGQIVNDGFPIIID